MTCHFCNRKGQMARITMPGFDNAPTVLNVEICEVDSKFLESQGAEVRKNVQR